MQRKKQVRCWLKNKEPGERIVRFWTLVLMLIFHEKCQSLGHVKNAKITLQHPIIFSVLASPWTTPKTEKRKFACSWEMKSVPGHLNIAEKRVVSASLCSSWFKNLVTGIDWTGRRAQATRARTTTDVQIGLPRPTEFATVQYFVQLPL